MKADLATYAKSLGNGYPAAGFGGRREIMSAIGRGVAHAGTFAGGPIGLAAADVVTDLLVDRQMLKRSPSAATG